MSFRMKGTWLHNLAPLLLAVETFPDFLTPVGFCLLGNMGVCPPRPWGEIRYQRLRTVS